MVRVPSLTVLIYFWHFPNRMLLRRSVFPLYILSFVSLSWLSNSKSIFSNSRSPLYRGACILLKLSYETKSTHRIKSNALFSYQPPFNILAFLILKPASWFFTPRLLHTINVFLIKLTSLPQLILISLYERHLASVRKPYISGKDAPQSFFSNLPMARHIKNIPLMEALTGSSTNDLFEAIFDIELDEAGYGLFLDESDGEEDLAALSSFHSRENFRDGRTSPLPKIRTRYSSGLGDTPTNTGERTGDPGPSNTLFPGDQSSPSSIFQSPLTRLFRSRLSSNSGVIQPAASSEAAVAAAQVATRAAMNTETSARHIETLLETVKELPVHKLREEMKELQVCHLLRFLLCHGSHLFHCRIVRHESRIFF